MGWVWVARHIELNAPVAIKFIKALPDGAHALVRFRREARAAAALRSVHIVHVYDYGASGDMPYLAMELLEGETLSARLERERVCSPDATFSIVAQAAKALKVAHAAGVVHRDIKPSNLFLAISGEDEIVKVLDFGIAKHTGAGVPEDDAHTTSFGAVVGTPSYMSPEQARGDVIDARCDLWALSVLTYRMLTGAEPFVGTSAAQVIARICTRDFARPTSVSAALDPRLNEFFERAFATQPSARFASVDELTSALALSLGKEPVRGTLRPLLQATEPPAAATLGSWAEAAMPAAERGNDVSSSIVGAVSVDRSTGRPVKGYLPLLLLFLVPALWFGWGRLGESPAAAPSAAQSAALSVAPAAATQAPARPETAASVAAPGGVAVPQTDAPAGSRPTTTTRNTNKLSPSAAKSPLGSRPTHNPSTLPDPKSGHGPAVIDPVFGLPR
jgi:serine/threonine-protein kinase